MVISFFSHVSFRNLEDMHTYNYGWVTIMKIITARIKVTRMRVLIYLAIEMWDLIPSMDHPVYVSIVLLSKWLLTYFAIWATSYVHCNLIGRHDGGDSISAGRRTLQHWASCWWGLLFQKGGVPDFWFAPPFGLLILTDYYVHMDSQTRFVLLTLSDEIHPAHSNIRTP
jgi:hypothetical protein